MADLQTIVQLLDVPNAPGSKNVPGVATRDSEHRWQVSWSSSGSLNQLFLVDLIDHGLPVSSLDRVAELMHWPQSELSTLLHVSPKTFRRYDREGRLFPPSISERIVDLTKVVAAGQETFEDMELFNEWMHSPCAALSRRKPVDLISNSEGVQLVLDELTRIDWGVYS